MCKTVERLTERIWLGLWSWPYCSGFIHLGFTILGWKYLERHIFRYVLQFSFQFPVVNHAFRWTVRNQVRCLLPNAHRLWCETAPGKFFSLNRMTVVPILSNNVRSFLGKVAGLASQDEAKHVDNYGNAIQRFREIERFSRPGFSQHTHYLQTVNQFS